MKKKHSVVKTVLTSLAFFTFLSISVASVTACATSSKQPTLNVTNRLLKTQKSAIDPSNYEEISSAQFVPKILSYTGTPLSRHLNVQFESQVINAYAASSKDVFYVIDDARFSGDRNNPFTEEVADKTLNGFVYQARVTTTSQKKLYISNSISYGSKFIIKTTKVVTNAMYQESDYDVSLGKNVITYDAYKNLEEIYICGDIEEIESGAFVNVPETVKIKCVASSKPAGWEDDWTDAKASQIQWGVALDDASKASVKHSGSTTSFGDAEDYILGYKGDSERGFAPYPLTISYDAIKSDGSRETRYQEIPTKHQTNPYDAVGSKIYGRVNSFEITINIDKGETIDEQSYSFYNIFKAQRYYIEEKELWPVSKIDEVLDNYTIPTDAGLIPSLEGNAFFYQTYETGTDKYITIATDFDTEEEADALVAQFEEKITSINVDKSLYQTEEDLSYTLISDYDEAKYGKVYNVLYKAGEVRTNIYIQLYSYFNTDNSKYEFITYIVLDNPYDEVDEATGELTGKLINSQNPFPISAKANAIRPFVYVPEYVEKDGQKTPKQGYVSHAIARFDDMVEVGSLLTTRYKSSSRFLNYTSVSMYADKVLGIAYAGYLPDENGKINEKGNLSALIKGEDGKYYHGATAYEKSEIKLAYAFYAPLLYIQDNSTRSKIETNLPSILSGEIKFRYTLANLNTASLIVSYMRGSDIITKELPIKSPSPVIELNQDSNNVVSFLINNASLESIPTENIVAVGISGVTINVHLYNTSSHAVVQNTQYLNIFGNIEVYPNTNTRLSCFNANIYLLLFFLVLTVVYVLLTVILFFYKKNKYKNDEFRRMRPKAYFKSAALGFVGLLLITASINFIVLRFGVFNSTVPTYNPIDAFVIGFTIFAAIALGLFIKNFVSAIKLMKHRHEIARLHLDKDVVDDGTH